MTPKTLRQELTTAYEGHDHDAFVRALDRMEAMLAYAGPVDRSHEQWPGPSVREAMGELEAKNALKNCTRRTGPCECQSPHAQATCMYRSKR